MMKRVIATLAAFVLTQAAATAQTGGAPEAALLDAMRYSEARSERLGDTGVAMRAYIATGHVDRKPTRRMDYTDYRLLKKPARLLGQKLLVIEEEYLTQYIGCCVSSGVGAIVELAGDEAGFRDFAKRNRCAIDEKHVRDDLRSLGVSDVSDVSGKVASISCRERDAFTN